MEEIAVTTEQTHVDIIIRANRQENSICIREVSSKSKEFITVKTPYYR